MFKFIINKINLYKIKRNEKIYPIGEILWDFLM